MGRNTGSNQNDIVYGIIRTIRSIREWNEWDEAQNKTI